MLYNKEVLRQKVIKLVPFNYYNYLNIFSKVKLDTLVPFRLGYWDYKIELINNVKFKNLGFNPLYKIITKELKVYLKYVNENLIKRFIKIVKAS